LTITGVVPSAGGGVRGGALSGETALDRDKRRMRSEDADLWSGFSTAGGSGSALTVLDTGSDDLSDVADVAVLGLLSSLELFSELFLDRKTSRSRLLEDCFESD
jgi:hypothetical protein